MANRGKQIAQINMESLPQGRHTRKSSMSQQDTEKPSSSRRGSIDHGQPFGSRDSHLIAPASSTSRQLSIGSQGAVRRGDKELGMSRWEEAAGNLEDARLAFDSIARTVNDAIYLDEDSYNQMTPVMRYTDTIQAQERRIEALEADLANTRHRLEESNAIQTEALKRHADMQQELENNAVVFTMHYEELLKRDEEIKRLSGLVEKLTTQE